MKRLRSIALLSCLVFAAVGCKKKDAAPGSADGSGTAAGSAGSAAGSAGSAAGSAGSAAGSAGSAAGSAGSAAGSAGSAAGSAAPAGDDVTITVAPAKVGDKSTETTDEVALMKVEAKPGQLLDIEQKKHEVKVIEVVAVDGNVMTKAKVSFPEMTNVSTLGGKSKDKPEPVVGKSYLVWREGTELKVTHEDGSEVSPEEHATVAKAGKDVGHADPMSSLIASKTWKVGVKVDLTAEELAALAAANGHDDEDPKPSSISLTLKSADANILTFDLVMAMELKSPKGEMKMELTSVATIDRAKGRPIEMTGGGPMSGNMGAPVTGTFTAKSTYAY
ncbi:MAG: hypothetical protein K8W52_25265 [Deltaproteobacteria bacterium]|nr:hypothetical protein [Deltaproteobacteria bacterium]